MLTLFLVFIITKGALTLYEGNTIGRGAVRGGDTAQMVSQRRGSRLELTLITIENLEILILMFNSIRVALTKKGNTPHQKILGGGSQVFQYSHIL